MQIGAMTEKNGSNSRLPTWWLKNGNFFLTKRARRQKFEFSRIVKHRLGPDFFLFQSRFHNQYGTANRTAAVDRMLSGMSCTRTRLCRRQASGRTLSALFKLLARLRDSARAAIRRGRFAVQSRDFARSHAESPN
jgi:hypothetical protein